MDYDNYISYIKGIVKKYASYSDTVKEYYIEGWKNEFSKLTDIKPGTDMYFGAPGRVDQRTITGYYINIDDEIFGGVMFYPMAGYSGRVKLPEDEILVCTPGSKITKIDNKGITDKNTVDKFKTKLLPMLKDLTYTDWEGEQRNKAQDYINFR